MEFESIRCSFYSAERIEEICGKKWRKLYEKLYGIKFSETFRRMKKAPARTAS